MGLWLTVCYSGVGVNSALQSGGVGVNSPMHCPVPHQPPTNHWCCSRMTYDGAEFDSACYSGVGVGVNSALQCDLVVAGLESSIQEAE